MINRKELAVLLGVSVETLKRWAESGHGPPAIKIGPHRVVYRRRDVERWISSLADKQRAVVGA